MATSSACPCQTWRRYRSWSSNWNPPTAALMSAESAIVQEHQHAHLTSLVSEQIWGNAMLSICVKKSIYLSSIHPSYIHIQHEAVIFFSIFYQWQFGSLTLPPYPTAQPYNAEFYFDTPNPVRILRGNNYSYNLQWTQKDPEATDRIIGYWVNIRKVKYSYTSKYSLHTHANTTTCSQAYASLQACIHTHVHVLDLSSGICNWRTGRYQAWQTGTHCVFVKYS